MKKDKALTVSCPKCQAPAGQYCKEAWYGVHNERRERVGQAWRKCPNCIKGLLRLKRNANNPVPKHKRITYHGEWIGKYTPQCQGSGQAPIEYPKEQ